MRPLNVPSLVCTITWANVEGLLNIAHKLCVPALQTQCVSFLVQHAAGRPFHALRIAELFGEEELFRESSRFVLDNPTDWHDLDTLSPETQLKLERRSPFCGAMFTHANAWLTGELGFSNDYLS
jgi:hypothetical protein